MRITAATLVFACFAVIGCISRSPTYDTDAAAYTNSWAVEVAGGKATADTLAQKHGFINLGKVTIRFLFIIIN